MQIEVVSLSPRDEHGMMLAEVKFTAKDKKVNNSAVFHMFVEASDSMEAMRDSAIKKAYEFARELLNAPPKEHIYTGL